MLVSVIIPTYNRAGTIERALKSVFAQTWRPLEVIVVDSQSTDRTAEILATYGDRIRVISQPKLGPGFARNAGIKAAKGEIITFLDSDDEWLPGKTERQVKLLAATKSAGVNCCVCNARMEFAAGTVHSFDAAGLHPDISEGIWNNPAEVLTTRFLFFNQVAAVRREVLERIGCFRQGIMEDYDLALRLSLLGPWAFIADPLVVWYQQPGDNLSQTHSQPEICRRTMDILNETSSSPDLGPLMPQALLHRRLRFLKRNILGFRLSSESSALARISGRFLLWYLKGNEKLYQRGPCFPQMVTRGV